MDMKAAKYIAAMGVAMRASIIGINPAGICDGYTTAGRL